MNVSQLQSPPSPHFKRFFTEAPESDAKVLYFPLHRNPTKLTFSVSFFPLSCSTNERVSDFPQHPLRKGYHPTLAYLLWLIQPAGSLPFLDNPTPTSVRYVFPFPCIV
jgi:hypothetical protein